MGASPPIDPALWGTTLAGLIGVGLLPGLLAVGWVVRRHGWLAVVYASAAAGVLISPVLATVADGLDLTVTPFSYGAAALAVAAIVQMVVRNPFPDGALLGLDRPASTAVIVACAAMALLLLVSMRDFAVPHNLHDASNHAFLTQRIATDGGVSQGRIFSARFGSPPAVYLPTWHVLAAMGAALTGTAPWISSWFLPLLCVVGLPLGLGILWRAWGFSGAALLIAVGLPLANEYAPVGWLGWGGFSTAVAAFATPGAIIAVRWARSRDDLASAVLCGATLASLALLNAGAGIVALGVGLAWPGPRRWPGAFRTLAALIGLAAVGGPAVWTASTHYVQNLMSDQDPVALDRAVNSVLNSLGRWDALKLALLGGLVVGYRTPAWRWVAIMSTAVGLLYLTLSTLADPVSRFLATPFYRETGRLGTVQLYFLPPLAGAAVVAATSRLRGRPRWRATVIGVLAVAFIGPGATRVADTVRGSRPQVALSAAAASLARQAADVVPPGARVANHWGDGSVWAGQLGSLDMLQPCGWALYTPDLHRHEAIAGLAEDPWPAVTLRLRDHGVQYLWVSDTVVSHVPPSPFSTARMDHDPRFQAALTAPGTALYRIEWPRSP